MNIFKIYNTETSKWMKEGGKWANEEKNGKVWRLLNHATCAIENVYPIKGYYRSEKNVETRSKIQIVKYEVLESERFFVDSKKNERLEENLKGGIPKKIN